MNLRKAQRHDCGVQQFWIVCIVLFLFRGRRGVRGVFYLSPLRENLLQKYERLNFLCNSFQCVRTQKCCCSVRSSHIISQYHISHDECEGPAFIRPECSGSDASGTFGTTMRIVKQQCTICSGLFTFLLAVPGREHQKIMIIFKLLEGLMLCRVEVEKELLTKTDCPSIKRSRKILQSFSSHQRYHANSTQERKTYPSTLSLQFILQE